MSKLKILCIIILLLAIAGLYIGFNKPSGPGNEKIISLYHENKEIFNNIQIQLFSSGYTPNGGVSSGEYISSEYDDIRLYHKEGKLLIEKDSDGKKLEYFQNVYDDAVKYFSLLNKKWNPEIRYRSIFIKEYIVLQFVCYWNYEYEAGIMYTTDPDKLSMIEEHIEGNWYVYRYYMV